MVFLHMVAREFSIKGHDSVRAAYNSLEEAMTQAEHNLKQGKQRPLRIEDENGTVLKEF